jgi:putative serine/threonine protein kinase
MFKYFTQGKRGILYKGKFKGKDVVLKMEKRNLSRINNEIFWLLKLNKVGIGPRLLLSGSGWFIYPFVEGVALNAWVVGKSKVRITKVFRQILLKCRILDKLKVNKYEMHRPFKNVLIFKDKAKLLDFERCKVSLNPKNVTQFCQFIISVLKLDRSRVLPFVRDYSKDFSEKNFKLLVKNLF